MAPQTTQLVLPTDLDRDGSEAADRDALRAVARWIDDFVAQPHEDLGRAGSVCPFVPGSLERRVLWFAPERVGDLDVDGVARLMDDYKRLFLETAPRDDDDAIYKTIVVVFTDLSAERAGPLFAGVQDRLAAAAYEEDGIIFGPFYEGNDGTALYNPGFRPFQSPVPFLFVRHTVLGDWKFFLDDDDQLERWARWFGPAAGVTLGRELRGLPWRGGAGSAAP